MFHGWMFDPDGDQAATDSTRSSTSLDTGSSVNPRTARRLLTASYTSMVASLPLAIRFVETHTVSTPMGLAPNERRRRRPPHGRQRGMKGEWPPATRDLPPAPAKVGLGHGPPPRGRVQSR